LAADRIGVHLGCDVGTARIGLARCDRDGVLTTPLPAIPADDQAFATITDFARQEQAVAIVVGYPLGLDGEAGKAARIAADWATRLSSHTAIPVILHDERLSTIQAQRRFHEVGRNTRSTRNVIDSASAAVILEAYLGRKRLETDEQ
jgi:putative holliday junction resolvase